MTTHEVTVRHNFETGHRLPHLPGKCQSLHGHSWWAEVTATSKYLQEGILVDFGAFKAKLRAWIDTNLDHGVMLGAADPLREVLPSYGTKIFVVHDWPTVETVAEMIALEAAGILEDLDAVKGAMVTRCVVRETHVNEAAWIK